MMNEEWPALMRYENKEATLSFFPILLKEREFEMVLRAQTS